ncbi:N-acetylmuramoyl-L-alanine amidase (EC [Olavius algarvensis Delta 1 endosymbiont]|nr:N-acetylmuramoyl-L-alanine amidase (EC [Olavius algarvensis Delta 1 endosymbiont]
MFKKNHILLVLLLSFGACIVWSAVSAGPTPRQAYISGESCYKKLRNSPAKMKYRDNWLRCIKKFQQVYRLDPAGPWAAAGLYMSGNLYRELAKYSGRRADLQEARDIYERIIKRYPSSRYQNKAALALRNLSASRARQKQPDPAKSAKSGGQSAADTYRAAEACYGNLSQDSRKRKQRVNWMQCIEKFYDSYRKDPAGSKAPAGLFMTGKLYADLYGYSDQKSDLRAAHTMYERIIDKFPTSRYRVKAELLIDSMPGWAKSNSIRKKDDLARMIDANAKSSPGSAGSGVKKIAASPAIGIGTVDNLRFWSNPNYTRVVIDASHETPYKHHLLKKDPELHKPQRLYIDLMRSRLGQNIKRNIPINDDLLTDARAGQYTGDSVRVVIDIKSFKTYKVFSLKDPFRIVIDVWGTSRNKKSRPQPPVRTTKKSDKLPTSALAKQLALGVSRIIIDPGHGGRDYGAPGYLKGVHEKKVVLQIARRLAKMIRKELKYEVYLTRDSDKFLTLEERTAIANTKSADLFISIHTNSHKDRRAYGIETYFLNLATDDDAIRVAAMENATSTKNISDLQTILSDLMQNAKINESSRLAGFVQTSVVRHLKTKRYSRIRDKGVKQAPFYVLLGAQMPAILVETGFISNPRECKRLITPKYQERLCEAIIKGIRTYIRETSPTAFLKSRPQTGVGG